MTAELIHAGLGWPVALAAAGLSFGTSFITAAFGIGGGAIMLAALAVMLPPAALIPVHGLVQLGSNGGRTAVLARHVQLGVMGPFAIGAGLGIVAGSLLLIELPSEAILITVGIFILYTVYFPPPAFLQRHAGTAGGFSSLLTMFVGATGPFIAAFVKSQGYDKITHVATHSAMMTLQHLLKTIAFGLLGFAFSKWAGFITLLIATGFAGTMAGRHVLARLDEARFKQVLGAILTVIAIKLIWDGVSGLIEGRTSG